jgi:c-di-GMP-binding flagellar brake protein YcgR
MKELLTVETIFSQGSNLLLRFSEELGYIRALTVTVQKPEKDEIILMIEPPEVFSKIKLGTEITLSYQTSDGEEYLFGSYLIKKIIQEAPILIIAQPKDVSFTSLRRYRRTNVKLPFEMTIKGTKVNGLVVNLSPCGLLASITPIQNLQLKEELTFELKFPTHPEPIQLIGQLVRSEIIGKNQKIALNFLNTTDETREIILAYTLYN